jgi:hypothetical protein
MKLPTFATLWKAECCIVNGKTHSIALITEFLPEFSRTRTHLLLLPDPWNEHFGFYNWIPSFRV